MAVEKGSVVLQFKADIKDAKRKIRDLEKENKKLAKTVIEEQKRQAAGLERQIAMLGKLTIGVGAAVGAYKLLSDSSAKFAKQSQLEAAAVGADIAKIQRAAGGLLTEYQSLQFAAAALNTDFKLSQKEMQEVSKFMVVLRNQGNDLDEVYREVTKSIVEGNVEGLKKFGIVMQDIKPGLEAHEAIMSRIAEENRKAGDNIHRAGDETLIAANQWSDATHKMSVELGKLGNALAPAIRTMTKFVNLLVGTIEMVSSDETEEDNLPFGRRAHQRAIALAKRQGRDGTAAAAAASRRARRDAKAFGASLNANLAVAGSAPGTPGRRGGGFTQDVAEIEHVGGFNPDGFGDVSFASPLGDPVRFNADAAPDKSIKEMVESSRLASEGMAELEAVGVQAFAALITGAEGFGAAIKRAMGQSLMAKSLELVGEAIRHGVFALGALAFGDARGAAQHGVAAAKAAAGAAALGGMARILGAGQTGASQAAGAAAGSGGAGGGADVGSNITVILAGDEDRRSASRRTLSAIRQAEDLDGTQTLVLNE